jgi:hypothetical protein
MGRGKDLWKKTEGGSGGKRGHSNMDHRETTEYVKKGARRARRFQDRQAVADELNLLNLSATEVNRLLRESDRDIDV